MDKKFLIFNWKNYLIRKKEADKLIPLYLKLKKDPRFKVVLAPPLSWLGLYPEFERASQDVSLYSFKDLVGEVPAINLKNLGVKYTIIGHSSRRIKLKESDEQINQKIKIALASGLYPVFCLGENRAQRKKGLTAAVLKNQLKKGLKDIKPLLLSKIIFVYEPVWAIYPQAPDTPRDALEMVLYLLKTISQMYGFHQPQILYGGSVNGKNINDFLAFKEIKGALIGYAGTKEQELEKIIEALHYGKH